MKKMTLVLLGAILCCALTMGVTAADDIVVLIDGEYIQFDVPPQIINNRTMVSMRAIFEAFGATVEWDAQTRTVTADTGWRTIAMTIGEYRYYINGTETALDVPAQIVNNRTLVPVRAISEALDCQVGWDGKERIVSIIEDWQNYQMLYADGGRQRAFHVSEVPGQLTVGWFDNAELKPSVLAPSQQETQLPATPNDDGIYSSGETWIVDDQWEFTIDRVEEHYLCNPSHNEKDGFTNEQVIVVSYSYKNIGYQDGGDGLYMSWLEVYDEEGETSDTYACTHTKFPKECRIGTKCTGATEEFVLKNRSESIMIDIEHRASDGTGKHRATYIVPVEILGCDNDYQGERSEIEDVDTSDTPSVSQLNSFVSFFKLGIQSHTGVFNCLTGYIKYGSNSFISLMESNLQSAYRNFSDALAISEKYSDMDDITDIMEQIIESIASVFDNSYNVIEIEDILEPNADRFDDILDEVKVISNYQ